MFTLETSSKVLILRDDCALGTAVYKTTPMLAGDWFMFLPSAFHPSVPVGPLSNLSVKSDDGHPTLTYPYLWSLGVSNRSAVANQEIWLNNYTTDVVSRSPLRRPLQLF